MDIDARTWKWDVAAQAALPVGLMLMLLIGMVAALAVWRPVFDTLHRENHITHFSFLDKNLVCLLRVHKPEKRGDRIERFIAIQAEGTGKTTCDGDLFFQLESLLQLNIHKDTDDFHIHCVIKGFKSY